MAAAPPSAAPGASDALWELNDGKDALPEYLRRSGELLPPLPAVEVTLDQAALKIMIPKTDAQVTNLGTFFCDVARHWRAKDELNVVHPTTVTFKPGRMCLVLGAPGAGKSSLLRLISGRKNPTSGTVRYNGLKPSKLGPLSATRVASLIQQTDEHVALLTVKETFEFAAACSDDAAMHAEGSSDELRKALAAKPAMMSRLLGLDECENTVVGSDMVRGVSGGQKRRVTVGEMLLTDARVLCGDEITNGLDAAVAADVVAGIREFTRARALTSIIALQQPTPELLQLFDDICLMSDGHIIFKGPLASLEPYLNARGFICPPASDLADWLIEVVTDPALAREHGEASGAAAAAIKAAADAAKAPASGGSPALEGAVSVADVDITTVSGLAAEWRRQASAVAQLDAFIPDAKRFPSGSDAILHASPFACAKFGVGVGSSFLSQLSRTMSRQAKLTLRNPVLIQARFFATVLNTVVFGTLFYQPDEENFALRFGIALFILIYLSFSNFSELPVTFQARRTAYKQTLSGFYTELPFITSVWVVHLPIAIINSTIASSIIYWLVGFAPNAPSFLFFVLGTILTELTMASWFRMMSLFAPTEELANTLSGSSTGIFLLFSGFLLTREKMPGAAIALYYISPFAWITRALMLNEFGNDRYQDIIQRPYDPPRYVDPPMVPQRDGSGNIVMNFSAVPPSPVLVEAFPPNTVPQLENVTQRVAYLEAFEFPTDDVWRWSGIGVLAIYSVLFGIVLSTVALRFCRHNKEVGTRRTRKEGAAGAARSPGGTAAAAAATTAASAAGTPSVSSSFPFERSSLAFHDLRYTVFVKEDIKSQADELAGGTDKGMLAPDGSYKPEELERQGKMVGLALLRNIHGVAAPGRMVALMGASGAGKTTLMDCLCGRKNQGNVEGQISINGRTTEPAELAKSIAYVEQTDLHFPEATVREALLFSAALRLPASITAEQREAFVDENLGLLELTTLRDRPVKTLAPGEMKRLTIGVELCANPAILALDEPTTGLDAKSAAVVMKVVRNIASTGRSVLATIHQPSSSIFLSFDDLLLLERGGRQVYFGELGHMAASFVEFLEGVPGVRKLPPRTNPATWMLEEVARFQAAQLKDADAASAADGAKDEAKSPAVAESGGGSSAKPSLSLARVYAASPLSTSNAEMARALASGDTFEGVNPIGRATFASKAVAPAGSAMGGRPVGFCARSAAVWGRVMADYWRNNAYNASRLIVLIVLGTVFGLAYLNLDTTKDEAGVRSVISALYSSAGFGGTISFSSLLPALGKRRAAFYREKSVGMYTPAIYYLAITVTELIFLSVLLLIFTPILYFLVGLRADAEVFFESYLVVLLVATWFICNAQLFAALMPSIAVAQIVSGAVLLTQTNLFSGIFLPPADIPPIYSWIYSINPTGLATRGLALIQFHTPEGSEPVVIDAFVDGQFGAVDRQSWVEQFVDSKWENRFDVVWQIAVIALTVETLAILALTFINHSKR
ncbi:hypothetical protein FNF27_06572 [Cafeteria roenbergensis]|uniref:ABC transporter domain-containing protein n=2 Tax=Cafeteria roenbergensis TaxID=33653 RepID=A0A5A8E376_CAFRO|nr:hypothetical protein FNF27_06572 [Cafeteria roenbergensis]